ncbi:lactonase family protein [Streptomyces litchfieldiae]|uniref:Lactonase family protein n=1 Tax=Streptomyces litchfieldiae TaxID=3075543 RepID=A0ABU2MPR4_9ACTN|nr:lactonase family protein [Streptomyces sp. DSM 44938]MDT0343540.1 lactonase family protein [Streptomyces sp. DSM 44938]
MTPQPTRRTVLTLLGTTAGGLPLAEGAARGAGGTAGAASGRVFLGGYSGGDPAAGIGVAGVDEGTGELRLETVVPGENPSFLALSASGRVLYAVNETRDGTVSAFALDEDGAVLGSLGTASSGGASPCHLSVHPLGGHLFTANYESGTIAVVALREDGGPGEVTQVVQHTGSGPDPERQTGPHAHMVLPDPGGERLFAVDLGTDSVHVYAFDPGPGTLTRESELKMTPGSGPRHLAPHPGGRAVYVVGELDCTLTTCAYDPGTGALTPLATVSALPPGTPSDGAIAAGVRVSADGRFVYASVRGQDSVAVFAVEEEDGTALRLLSHHPAGGRTPRDLYLDEARSRVYVANQDSGLVAVLDRDPADGGLAPAREALAFPRVTCVLPL